VFRDLKSPRDPRFRSLFVVEGLVVTERLLESQLEVTAVVTEPRYVDWLAGRIADSVPIYVLTRDRVERLAGFHFHRGVLCCGRRPVSPPLTDFLPPAPAGVTLAVCVGVQDPENLGGIIRSGSAFGVGAVVSGQGCADPYSRRVARTSMGANFEVPIVEPEDLRGELVELRDRHGVRLVATVLDPSAVTLDHVDKPARTALLFGNEGRGLDDAWIGLCDQRVTIPMRPGVDSLNASVAAGIFLHSYRAAIRPPS
jgi:tRNA G18 (ribose-2'-O)-methylase SpoU